MNVQGGGDDVSLLFDWFSGLRASDALSVEFTQSISSRTPHTRTNCSYFDLDQDMLMNPTEAFSYNYEDGLFFSQPRFDSIQFVGPEFGLQLSNDNVAWRRNNRQRRKEA
jgi:hypothetical protein